MRRAFDFRPFFPVDRGFTLVEMIISIVITGIIVSMVAMFGRGQVEAYLDAGNRAELSDAADTTLRRIARELQAALPNSVRLSGNFLEFVPIHDAGRYRAELNATGGGDTLNFSSNTDNTFDVLGPSVTIPAGDQLVVFNLGQPGSDVYEGTSRRAVTPGVGLSNITFAPAGTQFPLASPQHRFQIVGAPVIYECSVATGQLIRRSGFAYGHAWPPVPAALGGIAAVMADNVAACAFNYVPAILQRNGLVVLRLTLTLNGESVQLLHQVDVLNTP
ncbi:MAG: prepilin-type N-terminal cleavage/methylation domain-containing protein [Azonexus sp.]|nr:prepilin-type N-terminal cleavage/methylation domain-containing protein [Azonexus sp.]